MLLCPIMLLIKCQLCTTCAMTCNLVSGTIDYWKYSIKLINIPSCRPCLSLSTLRLVPVDSLLSLIIAIALRRVSNKSTLYTSDCLVSPHYSKLEWCRHILICIDTSQGRTLVVSWLPGNPPAPGGGGADRATPAGN